MRKSKYKEPLTYENLTITSAGAEGKAIAKHEGLVVFISGAVPGDVVDVRVTKKKSSFAEAMATRIVTPSPDRIPAFCKHFGTCGGCKWQDLTYPKQIEYKQQQVIDSLERLGGIELPEVTPIMTSPSLQYYRNKLEYSFCNARWFTSDEIEIQEKITDTNALGFHIPRRFDRVLDLSECYLQPEPSNSVRNFCREYARQQDLSFYDQRAHVGFLRTLLIRTTTIGETMILIAFGHENLEAREALLAALLQEFPQLTSLMWTINTKKNDTIFDLDVHVFHGRDHIIEELADGPGGKPLRFRIGIKTFFQTNPEQTLNMYKLVRDLAGLTGKENVYDLYCGAGSITLYVAGAAKHVAGVELVPESIADAKVNAEFNGVSNVSFTAGDMKKIFDPAFVAKHGKPDVVITDPPRAGMDEPVVRHLLELNPPLIIYVSCNPATQARDLALMNEQYKVDHVQPIDMFPHTYHVENVVRLVRR